MHTQHLVSHCFTAPAITNNSNWATIAEIMTAAMCQPATLGWTDIRISRLCPNIGKGTPPEERHTAFLTRAGRLRQSSPLPQGHIAILVEGMALKE